MASITLKHKTYGVIYTRVYQIDGIRGLDSPDDIELWPPVINTFADGSMRTEFIGFRRIITADLGVIADIEAHKFLVDYLCADIRSIYYSNSEGKAEEIFIVPSDARFESDRVNNCVLGKKYVLRVTENVIRDYWTNYTPASDVDIMHAKLKVKIEGTQSSPEVFTTNSGKLATMENGQQFPNISLLTWNAAIVVNGSIYQSATVNIVGDVTQVGGDIQFSLAVSDIGNASADGFFYADILIFLQAIA